MNLQTLANCVVILCGAGVMLVSILKSGVPLKALPFVREKHRKRIKLYLLAHRGLMMFFLFGYLVVIVAFILGQFVLGESVVSAVFFFGALFVLIGTTVQIRLLAEVQRTIQGILPICARCKKIRAESGDPDDPEAWKGIEAYISEKTDVAFSHGYCPACFAAEMEKIGKMESAP
jgi:hypothetical protein